MRAEAARWRSSLVPGYPGDTSPLGSQSPTKGSCASAGDPTQAFDGEGRLYYGFICFNRAKPTNGSIYVARYDDDGAGYRFTTLVERGTPSVAGLFQDKINITADQNNGNVYVAWARFSGNLGNDVIMFTRSTDGGRTYSKPTRISDGGASVTAVFLGRRKIAGPSPGRRLVMGGVAGKDGTRYLVYNPEYQLLG